MMGKVQIERIGPASVAAKDAYDELIAAAYRAQGNALSIEARAKIRLADEYDAAQERGEFLSNGQTRAVSDANSSEDSGLTRQQIHEARKLRDAEKAGARFCKASPACGNCHIFAH